MTSLLDGKISARMPETQLMKRVRHVVNVELDVVGFRQGFVDLAVI
jgi:hypothetical protein